MTYSANEFKNVVNKYGEVFVVLESGAEYEIHGQQGYETTDSGKVRVEGLNGDEWIVAEFSLDVIEHVYTHKEV